LASNNPIGIVKTIPPKKLKAHRLLNSNFAILSSVTVLDCPSTNNHDFGIVKTIPLKKLKGAEHLHSGSRS